jgi:hypothetical protein
VNRAERLLDVLLVAAGAAAIAAAAFLALVHLDDRYQVGHVSGAWMGLAAAAADGELYPPLYEDGGYGGTRNMPLFFTLHAGLSEATGELLVSGKLLTLAASVALVVLLLVLLRRRGAGWPLALGLAGAVVASWAASSTLLGLRGDVLSVLLQLAAVALVAERVTTRRAVAAGVLSGLALLTKLSALWAPAAIVVWLALRSRRALVPFGAAYAATVVALGALADGVSRGRMHENLAAFALGGTGGEWHAGLRRLYELALRDQRSLWPILLVAGVACALALVRRPGVYELAFLASLAILAVVLRDVGAYENHLLDATVLACLVVARGVRASGRASVRVVAASAVLLAIALAARHTLVPDVRAFDDDRFTTQPLAGVVSFEDEVLSEDASLPLLAGAEPVVLDAFMLRRFPEDEAERVDELRARIERREFAHVVLLAPADDPVQYTSFDFNPEIAAAVERAYRLRVVAEAGPYWVYEPR